MDIKLNLLESFQARGSDGRLYKVMGYERLARDQSLPRGVEHWASTGTGEYRLSDGSFVDAQSDGSLRVHHSGVMLAREGASEAAPGAAAQKSALRKR